AGAPAITADRATAMLRAAVDSALMGGDDTSVPTVAPRAVKPAYPGGRFRLRVSGIRPDDASVSLLLGGEVLAPARKVAEAFEFEVVRAGLPRAAGGIAFAPATLIIEEGLSVRERLEKLFAPNNPNRFERLIGTDVKRRAVPIVLTLLPDRIGLARLYGTRMSLKRTAVRDLKKDVRTLTSVSETREALICVTADSGCEIDRASVRYRITGWNAYYETEYCDTVCDQPLPFSRPRGNPQGMCPRVRVPGGFKAPQTQSCLEKRFEVDKGQWTAEKACVALVARPLLRGVRALAAAEIGGQQRCLAPHQERVLVTKDPFSIGWSAARRVRLSKAYEGLTVAFAAADGNTHAMIPEGEDSGPLRLRWSAKDRVATIRANTRFWWD
ncbi:MAG: hypothetical protein R3229_11050, partial [Alphaproteobacteria bacterium]|nr:hypothetical protein [Alphaproteobacteria bacterium]